MDQLHRAPTSESFVFKALTDPSTNPAKLQELREKAARPGNDLLRYIAPDPGRTCANTGRQKEVVV